MIRFLQTPGRMKQIILGGLLLIICAAMVITLIPGSSPTNFGGRTDVVATVGDQQVLASDVELQARNIGRQQFPKGNVPDQIMPYLNQQAANSLIVQKALLVEAKRMGLKVTDQEFADEMRHGPLAAELFPNGNFIGEQAYENFVQDQFHRGIPQFEQDYRQDLLVNKLRNLITGGVTVPGTDIQQEFRRENTKVKFEYAVLSYDEIKKSIHPTEAELKTYYEQHKAEYANSIPEKRKVRYIPINLANLAAKQEITQQDLQRYYDEHRDEFRVPEQVNVRHILIKTPPAGADGKVDQKAVDAAKAKAEDIEKQLKAGADFAALAKKYSEDTASAKNGGSLGWITRGRTVPEFEQAAFSLPKGGTSGVIRTSYGFHIIHVDDKQPATMKSLDEVKSQIEPIIRQEKVSRTAENLANTVETEARTQGMDKAAADHGFQVVTTDFLARTDALPGIGNSPEFMSAVFNANEKSPPDLASTQQGYAVFQVLQIKPPATPTFEELRPRLVDEYTSQRAQTLLDQKTNELADRAKATHDLKKAAKELGATIKTSELVSPKDQVPDIGALSGPASVIFTLKPGEISGPVNNGRSGAVMMLLDKQEPGADEFAKSKDQIRDALLSQKRNEVFALFASNVRQQLEKDGKIRINQEELKVLTTPRGEAGS
ncbi:MAG TPA: peptidyl-prolyl cis-trans isomerase [Terriglobales bacterium]|nr:peptidyl-prolyl cis-trans isomerase [Terriglobales bacterium]